MNHLSRNVLWILGVVFTAIGTVGLVLTAVFFFYFNGIKNKSVATEAVVVDSPYNIFVTYELNGKLYEKVDLGFYASNLHEGDVIEVYVDPQSPREVFVNEKFLFLLIPGIIGLTFFIIGLPFILYTIHKIKRKAYLLENGKRLQGTVDRIDLNYNLTINGRHPFLVYCRYEDPSTGTIYKFKSMDITWFDPHDSYGPGDSINIFVNPEKYKDYYVDVVDEYAGRVHDFT